MNKDLHELEVERLAEKITIRVHKVIYQKSDTIDTSPRSVVKLSILPVPGKETILRSTSIDKASGDHLFNTSKPAVLSMSVADLKHKLYKQGACLRLRVEFYLGGRVKDTGPEASGSLYLPPLLSKHSGQLLTVPLSPSSAEDSECSVVLEVLSSDAASSSAAVDFTLAGTEGGSLELSISPQELNGLGIKDVFPLDSEAGNPSLSVRVEASLSASPHSTWSSTVSVANGKGKSKGKGSVTFKSKKGDSLFTLSSRCPSLDVLCLNFRRDIGENRSSSSSLSSSLSPSALSLGYMMVPLCCLTTCPSIVNDAAQRKRRADIPAIAPSPAEQGSVSSLFNLWRSDLDTAPTTPSVCVCTLSYLGFQPYAPNFIDTTTAIGSDAATINSNLTPTPAWAKNTFPSTFSRQNSWTTPSEATTPTPSGITPKLNSSFNKERNKYREVFQSSHGQLIVCLQGMFFSSPAAFGPATSSSSSVAGAVASPLPSLQSYTLKKTDSVFVEVTILPEGLKKRSPLSKLSLYSTSTPEAASTGEEGDFKTPVAQLSFTAEWNKAVSLLVVWALQQRQVCSLQISVMCDSSAVPATPNGIGSAKPPSASLLHSSRKPPTGGSAFSSQAVPKPTNRVLGSCTLDVASIIETATSTSAQPSGSTARVNSCLIPVRSTNSKLVQKTKGSRDVPLGWLLIGVQYTTSPGQDVIARETSAMETKLIPTWERLKQIGQRSSASTSLTHLGITHASPPTGVDAAGMRGSSGTHGTADMTFSPDISFSQTQNAASTPYLNQTRSGSVPVGNKMINNFNYNGIHFAFSDFEVPVALYQQLAGRYRGKLFLKIIMSDDLKNDSHIVPATAVMNSDNECKDNECKGQVNECKGQGQVRVRWDTPDFVIGKRLFGDPTVASIAYCTLYAGCGGTGSEGPGPVDGPVQASYGYNKPAVSDISTTDILCECSIVLPVDALNKGIPTDLQLPLQNKDGNRVVIVPLSIQPASLTAPGMSDTGNSDTSHSSDGPAALTFEEIPIKIEICEGNIVNSSAKTRRLEPFFECSVLSPEPSKLVGLGLSGSFVSKARTGFIKHPEKMENWATSCRLTVPVLSNAESQNITIGITSRDASKLPCPELGWSRLSIPISLLQQVSSGSSSTSNKLPSFVMEKWLTLTPPAETASRGVDMLHTSDARKSRVKVRICIDEAAAAPQVTPADSEGLDQRGIGVVCMQLHGVSAKLSLDTDIEVILTAELSSHALVRKDSTNRSRQSMISHFALGSFEPFSTRYSAVETRCFGRDMHMHMPDSTTLNTSVPVPGANCEIQVSLKTLNTNESYTGSYPVMTAVMRPSDIHGPLLLFPPLREISLMNTKRPNRSQSSKLRLETCFVPFVRGQLLIECVDILLLDPSLLALRPTPQQPQSAFSGALRFMVADDTSTFAYSNPFSVDKVGSRKGELAGKSKGRLIEKVGKSEPGRKPASGTVFERRQSDDKGKSESPYPPNVTSVNVDIFQLMSGSQPHDSDSGGRVGSVSNANSCMVPLLVDLFETDPHYVDGPQTSIGVGSICTAGLYYQALRTAASAPLHADGSLAAAAFGMSPNLAVVIDVVDAASSRRGAGTSSRGTSKRAMVSLIIRFKLESIDPQTLKMVEGSINKTPPSTGSSSDGSDFFSNVRTELELKQSFMQADADRSGAVSSAELLRVLSAAKNTEGPNQDKAMVQRNGVGPITLLSSSVSGQDKSMKLLLSLARCSSAPMLDSDTATARDFEGLVRQIFDQLDVDGDGQVSWWEWKSVLLASIYGRHPDYRFVDPMDALVVGMNAAGGALSSLQALEHGHSSLSFIELASRSKDTQGGLGYSAIAIAQATTNQALLWGDDFGDEFPQQLRIGEEEGSIGSDGLSRPVTGRRSRDGPSRHAAKLHTVVKSLRLTNNILAKRIENALQQANTLTVNEVDDTGRTGIGTGAPLLKDGAGPLTRSDAERLERNVRMAESESKSSQTALQDANKRIRDLMDKLTVIQSSNVESSSNSKFDEVSAFNNDLNSRLQREIMTHSQRLLKIKEQRLLNQQKIATVARFIGNVALPKLRNKIKERQETSLKSKLKFLYRAKADKSVYANKIKSVIMIQRIIRGALGRNRNKERDQRVTQIQRVYRGSRGRRERTRREKEKNNALEVWKGRCKGVVAATVLKWVHMYRRRQHRAAGVLQRAFRKDVAKKSRKRSLAAQASERAAMQAMREEKEKERMAQLEETAAMKRKEQKEKRAAEAERRKEEAEVEAKQQAARDEIQRQLDLFVEERGAVVAVKPVNIPTIRQATHGFWVHMGDTDPNSLPTPFHNVNDDLDFSSLVKLAGSQAQTHPQQGDRETPSSSSSSSSGLAGPYAAVGKVISVDIPGRLLSVKYCVSDKGALNKKIEIRTAPYDHPTLHWYKTVTVEDIVTDFLAEIYSSSVKTLLPDTVMPEIRIDELIPTPVEPPMDMLSARQVEQSSVMHSPRTEDGEGESEEEDEESMEDPIPDGFKIRRHRHPNRQLVRELVGRVHEAPIEWFTVPDIVSPTGSVDENEPSEEPHRSHSMIAVDREMLSIMRGEERVLDTVSEIVLAELLEEMADEVAAEAEADADEVEVDKRWNERSESAHMPKTIEDMIEDTQPKKNPYYVSYSLGCGAYNEKLGKVIKIEKDDKDLSKSKMEVQFYKRVKSPPKDRHGPRIEEKSTKW